MGGAALKGCATDPDSPGAPERSEAGTGRGRESHACPTAMTHTHPARRWMLRIDYRARPAVPVRVAIWSFTATIVFL